jgi:hypothetical protein
MIKEVMNLELISDRGQNGLRNKTSQEQKKTETETETEKKEEKRQNLGQQE